MARVRWQILLVLASVAGLLCLSGSAGGAGDRATAEATSSQLVVAGSGTNLPLIRLLAEAFGRAHPASTIKVPDSIGSSGGIRAAADGAVAVGLISRPLKKSEEGLGLTVLPYARTALVIGVHPSVPDDEISFEDLVNIYRGTKTRWQDGQEIVVLTREPGDSSLEVLERVVPGFKEAYDESQRAKRWTTLLTDQEMHRVLARTPFAIGLTDSGFLVADHLPIKPLKVNGVPPTPADVRIGRYTLVKALSFVFRKENLPPAAEAFLEFVRSREGERILTANGYLPER